MLTLFHICSKKCGRGGLSCHLEPILVVLGHFLAEKVGGVHILEGPLKGKVITL